MTHYKVTFDGTEYPYIKGEYDRDYSLEAQPFQIMLPIQESISVGGTVNIFRDGDLVYNGKIYETRKLNNPPSLVVNGFDFKRKTGFLPVTNKTVNDYAGSIIVSNLTNTGLTQGTISNYGGSLSMSFGNTDQSKFDRKRVFEECCFVTGGEINVLPSGTLNFLSQCGTNRSGTVIFKHGDLLQNWADPYTILQNQKVERVTVVGSDYGNWMHFGVASSGGYAVGDAEKTLEHKNLVTNSTCGSASAALLADFENDVKKAEIEVIDTFVGKAYDVFDSVQVQDDILDIDETLRIYHIHKSFGDKEAESTRLAVTNIQHLNTNGKLLLKTGEFYLENIDRGVDDFGKTKQYYGINSYFEDNRLIFTGEALTGYQTYVSGSGTITLRRNYLDIATGTTALSYAQVYGYATVNIAHNPSFKCKVQFIDDISNNLTRFLVGLGDLDSGGKQFGFKISYVGTGGKATVWADWCDGVNPVNLQDLVTIDVGDAVILEARLVAGTKIEFYVNDELEYTTTSEVPSTGSLLDFYCDVYNAAQTANLEYEVLYFTAVEDWL